MISIRGFHTCALTAIVSFACSDGSSGTRQSSGPEWVDAGEPMGQSSFEPELEMAACNAQYSSVECFFSAIDRYFAATECGASPLPVNPERRACLSMAYEMTDKAHLTCMEASQWKLAACAAVAACDLDKIMLCVDQQLARAKKCPSAPPALLDATEACTKLGAKR